MVSNLRNQKYFRNLLRKLQARNCNLETTGYYNFEKHVSLFLPLISYLLPNKAFIICLHAGIAFGISY